jgi:hypothetical protein
MSFWNHFKYIAPSDANFNIPLEHKIYLDVPGRKRVAENVQKISKVKVKWFSLCLDLFHDRTDLENLVVALRNYDHPYVDTIEISMGDPPLQDNFQLLGEVFRFCFERAVVLKFDFSNLEFDIPEFVWETMKEMPWLRTLEFSQSTGLILGVLRNVSQRNQMVDLIFHDTVLEEDIFVSKLTPFLQNDSHFIDHLTLQASQIPSIEGTEKVLKSLSLEHSLTSLRLWLTFDDSSIIEKSQFMIHHISTVSNLREMILEFYNCNPQWTSLLCQAISGNSSLQKHCVVRAKLVFTKINCNVEVLDKLSKLNILTDLTIISWFDDPLSLRIVFPRLSFLKLCFRKDHAESDSLPAQFNLHEHQSLRSLAISGMGSTSVYSSPFFSHLFESLRVNTTLENLDLEGIEIDENLAQIMFSVLEENRDLSKLNICLREMEVSEIFEIIQRYLESNCGRLEWLKVYCSGGIVRQPVSFFESMVVNRHLKFLWVDEVELEDEISQDVLKEKSKSSVSLVQVRFRGREWEEKFLQFNRQLFLSEIKASLFFKFWQWNTDMQMYREIFSFAGLDHQDDK